MSKYFRSIRSWVIQHVIDYDTDIDYTLTFKLHCTESIVKSKYIFLLVKFTSLTNEKNIELRIFLWSQLRFFLAIRSKTTLPSRIYYMSGPELFDPKKGYFSSGKMIVEINGCFTRTEKTEPTFKIGKNWGLRAM